MALTSGYFTYNYTKLAYQLEISRMYNSLQKAELELKNLHAQAQTAILLDATKIAQEFNTSITTSNKLATELRTKLKGVILVTKDCKPSPEFIKLWNESSR